MRRTLLTAAVLLLTLPAARADTFDRYTNPVLGKATDNLPGVQEVKRVPAEELARAQVLPETSSALLIVKTNGGRYAKVLAQPAQQKAEKGTVPMVLLERFACFKPEQDQALEADGRNVRLYPGFLFSLDLGQVVPAEVGGDLKFVVADGAQALEPVGKARLFLVTKPVAGTETQKTAKPTAGGPFDPAFFNGTYKLHDDGRRGAKLTLKVEADGNVSGTYVSDDSGRTYEVYGKVGNPKHQIEFAVKFPQTEQHFTGWLFTRDAKAITGSCRMQDRDFGFYALRVDEK
jgi:hypothetical protein